MPRIALSQVSAANTNRDGTGTLVTSYTAGEYGSIIHSIKVIATGTTTAGVVRVFVHDGANTRLYDEMMVDAITPSAADEVWEEVVTPNLTLKPGWLLKTSTHNAETFNVHVHATDL